MSQHAMQVSVRKRGRQSAINRQGSGESCLATGVSALAMTCRLRDPLCAHSDAAVLAVADFLVQSWPVTAYKLVCE